MVKTIEYSAGVTTVDFSKARSYGASNRYYAVRNYGDNDIFISASDTCADGVDGTKRVPAGECRGIDMEGHNVLFISAQGAGTAEIDTAAGISALGFNGGSKGGGSSGGVVTASGNPVQLDGLQGGVPFNSVEVSGKNLLDISQYSDRNTNGIDVKILGSSEIICNGISTGTSSYPSVKYKKIKANVGDKLTATAKIKSGNFTSADGNRSLLMFVFLKDAELTSGFNAIVAPNRIISAGYSDSATFTVSSGMLADDGTLNLAVQCRFLNGDVADNLIIGWQLEYGDTATDYEPPITGRELTVGVCGKNLVQYPYIGQKVQAEGITMVDNGDGSVTVNGVCDTIDATFYMQPITLLPDTDYVLSGCPVGGSTAGYRIQFTDNNWSEIFADFGSGAKIRVDKKMTFHMFRIIIAKGTVCNNLVFRPQLELGSTPTDYEPYHGTSYTITPDSNPYTVPVDIIQQGGINVLSIADDSNQTISVSGNKASEQLGMIFRTLDNAPVLLFDGTIPTSSGAYAEFDLVISCSVFIIVPTLNDTTTSGTTYAAGNCTVLPVDYAGEEEREFTLYGYPNGTQCVSRGYIKRSGSTFSVRGSSTTCAHLTIYGI